MVSILDILSGAVPLMVDVRQSGGSPNAYAERWVRTARQECLDLLLVVSRRHLERILRRYVRHYNAARPHRGLSLMMPIARSDLVNRDLMH